MYADHENTPGIKIKKERTEDGEPEIKVRKEHRKKDRRSKDKYEDVEIKVELEEIADEPGSSYTPKAKPTKAISPIAQPLASPKLTKKIHKLIVACAALNDKIHLRNGLKDVQSSLRKNVRGVVIFAGDVLPVEIMCHMPGVCEEMNVPYIYVLDRSVLGAALGIPRGSVMVMVVKHENYANKYDEVVEAINSLPPFP